DPVSHGINVLPKYVPSTTLNDPTWQNTHVISGDVEAAIRELKAQPGRELQVHGSGELLRWLLERDLVDEINLRIYPVIVGDGLGGLSLLDRRDTRCRRPSVGTTAVRDDAVLGDRRSGSIARRRRARVGRPLESAPKGGVLHHAVGGAGQCPPRLRRPGGGDRAVASRAGGGRHRDRRRDARRRGGRLGPDRRIPGHGLPGAGWRWRPVLSAARAPGGSRTRRDPHLQLESRLPPLPRGALVGSSARCGRPLRPFAV